MEYHNLSGLAAYGQTKKEGQVYYCDDIPMKIQSATVAGWRQRYWRHLQRVADFGNLRQIKCIERTRQ